MAAPSAQIGRAVRFGVLELALLLLGMLFIRREIWQLHAQSFDVTTWQEGLLIPLAAIDGAVTGAFALVAGNVQNTPASKGAAQWVTPVFFLLYVGCCALCERINFGELPTPAGLVVRTIGIAMVLAGIAVRIWAQRTTPLELDPAKTEDERASPTGPHRILRHPDAAGKLLSLCGLPLAFNAWLPILALPGVIIMIKWRIADQEAFRIDQLGEPYLEYREKTWNLIPYLY